jgi:Surface lipoprotein assembly modifier
MKYMSLLAFMALIFLLELGFLPESSLAQQGFKWGRMEIHPGVAFEAKYDSNVFYLQNAQDDFIYTIIPSLTIGQQKQPGDNFGFFLRYSGRDERFVEFNDLDYYSQYASGNIELGDAGGDINWTLGGQFLDSRDVINPEFAATRFAQQVRTLYGFQSNLVWRLTNDIEADIGGEFVRNLFEIDRLQEFDQYNGNATFKWQTTALTGIGVNFSSRQIEYLEANAPRSDNSMYSGSFILEWQPFSVFRSEFWIGINHLNVDDTEAQDRDDMIFKVLLEYEPNTTSSWTLETYREIPKSFFRNVESYQNTAVDLSWNKKLGVKWESQSIVSYNNREYDTPALDVVDGTTKWRSDNYLRGSLSLTYSIQDWWNVIMEYSYTRNDSNFSGFDYSKNLVFLRLSFIL